MRKPKIIFIGDYQNTKAIALLEAFINRFTPAYDVSVTGYNFNYIKENPLITNNCSITYMNSAAHMLDKKTAEYVVITTQAPRYVREKNNQTIIYVISDFDSSLFAGCIGDISQIITDSTVAKETIETQFKHIKVSLSNNNDEQNAVHMVEQMDIDLRPNMKAEDYLFVAYNEKELFKDAYGAGNYLKKVAENPTNGFIALTFKGAAKDAPANLVYRNPQKAKAIIQEFTGIIVFESEYIRGYFDHYIKLYDIRVKASKLLTLEDIQILQLQRAVEDHARISFPEDASNYVKYRSLIERLYDLQGCVNVKVSIIICRYNTPFDLVKRAVSSALNSGHENVEVLLIDDGSENSIEKEIRDAFDDNRIKYYYKQNEGLGLSRNFGVRHAEGKYVFYLDSDDTLHKNGLPCLVSHAEFFGLKLTIGKRILCDEDGTPRIESLRYLVGDTFTCYYSDTGSQRIYDDVMVNNLLILKQAIIDTDTWFTTGLYEDIEYSARLYRVLPEYHYINIAIHDWYQYGDNSTISSTVSINNLKERIIKEERAWASLPEKVKEERIVSIISSDFNLYLSSFYLFERDEMQTAWELMRDFVNARNEYLKLDTYPESSKELIRAFLNNDYFFFTNTLDRYFAANKDEEGYDNYIVLTHYHLYVACLYAISSKRRSRLFICHSYVAFDTNLIYKIKECGVFEKVIPFGYGAVVGNLFNDIKKRPGEEDLLIPHYLYSYFRDIFKVCNTKADTAYIFSDTHPYWYYIERTFNRIIKLEDAYKSFDREVKTHEMQGIWAGIQKYQGTIYPKMFFRSDKIQKIILSNIPQGLPDEYLKKIEVIDTKILAHDHYGKIRDIMLHIYNADSVLFTEDTVMLLTQPLALFGYCSEKEQKELMKKMCESHKGSPLLIKPHPADNTNYNYLGGTILPKSVPIEVYNFLDVTIKSAITFGSSAIETIEFADEKVSFFKLHDFEFDDVVMAIKELIKEDPPKDSPKKPPTKKPGLKKRLRRKIKKLLK